MKKKKKMGKAIERTGILRTILLLFFEKITRRGAGKEGRIPQPLTVDL